MTDISKIPDPTSPEEYDRQRRERAQRQTEIRSAQLQESKDALMGRTADAQMDRIETKLDRILEILERKP